MERTITHAFNVSDAVQYGVEEAVLLYNLRFWLDKNKANKRNAHKHSDGEYYYWTYNSAKAFVELFPYMSEDKVQRVLKAMESKGIIISGNFNTAKYDRTKWYSIPQEYHIKSAELRNQFGGSAEPIPDINTDIKTDTISEAIAPLEKEFNFEEECLKIQQDDRVKYRYGKIVVWFLQEKGIVPINKQQWKQLFTRNIRTARLLADWSDNQILDAMDRIKKNPNLKDEWTLETINKYIMK